MSYARWSRSCDWYIFWHADSGHHKQSQLCAIWNIHVFGHNRPTYSFKRLNKIANNNTWGNIRGYDNSDSENKKIVRDAVNQFIADMNCEFTQDGYGMEAK